MSSTSGLGSRAVSSRRSTRHFPADDEAVAEIISSILMVSMTVVISLGLVALLVWSDPGPGEPLHVTLGMELDAGADGQWGTNQSDDTLRLVHLGGEPIPVTTTRIAVEINGVTTIYEPSDLIGTGGFTDDSQLELGESWETPAASIPNGRTVNINLISTKGDGELAWSSSARTGTINCDTDTTDPFVTSWTQTPDDVTTQTTGDVTVRIEVFDACDNLNPATAPELAWRVNDGSDPAFTSLSMTLVTGTDDQWEADITGITWSDHPGDTLEYKVRGMADTEGNTAPYTDLQDDLIELTGAETFIDPATMTMVFGTIDNADNAADDGDAGAAARITEDAQPVGSSTTDEYATTDSGTGTATSAATGAPEGTYAAGTFTSLDDTGETVQVGGFSTGSGSITKVELVFAAKHDNGQDHGNGNPDTVTLTHSGGSSSLTDSLKPAGDTYVLDITADDSDWTWSEISSLTATITCDCHDHNADKRVFQIDALWVRVTADTVTYDLETDPWSFDPIADQPGTYYLETRYKVTGDETFALEIQEGSSSTWTQIRTLDASTYTTEIIELTANQLDLANDGPQIRIVDLGTTDSSESYVQIDHVKVVYT